MAEIRQYNNTARALNQDEQPTGTINTIKQGKIGQWHEYASYNPKMQHFEGSYKSGKGCYIIGTISIPADAEKCLMSVLTSFSSSHNSQGVELTWLLGMAEKGTINTGSTIAYWSSDNPQKSTNIIGIYGLNAVWTYAHMMPHLSDLGITELSTGRLSCGPDTQPCTFVATNIDLLACSRIQAGKSYDICFAGDGNGDDSGGGDLEYIEVQYGYVKKTTDPPPTPPTETEPPPETPTTPDEPVNVPTTNPSSYLDNQTLRTKVLEHSGHALFYKRNGTSGQAKGFKPIPAMRKEGTGAFSKTENASTQLVTSGTNMPDENGTACYWVYAQGHIAGTGAHFVVPLEVTSLIEADKKASGSTVQNYLTGIRCKGVSGTTFGKWAPYHTEYEFQALNLDPVEEVITINCEDIDVISSPMINGWMYNNPTWYTFNVASAGVYAVTGSISSMSANLPGAGSLGDVYYYGTWVAIVDPAREYLTDAEGTRCLLNFVDKQSSYIGGECIEEGTVHNPNIHTGQWAIDFSEGDRTGNTATAWVYLSKGYHSLAIAVHCPQSVDGSGTFEEGREQKRYAAVTNVKLTLRKFPGLNTESYDGKHVYKVDDWRDHWSTVKHSGKDTSLSSSGECYRLNYNRNPINVIDYQQYLITRLESKG